MNFRPPGASAQTDFSNLRTQAGSAVDASTHCVVAGGGSPSKIAARFCGNANPRQTILDTGRDRLSEPDRIKPDPIPRIPDNPEASEVPMKMTRQTLMLSTAVAAAIALSACGKSNEPTSPNPSVPPPSATAAPPPMAAPPTAPPPASTAAMPAASTSAAVRFSSVEIGSSVDADNMIRTTATSFAPKDSIYASVETVGSGHATLAAKWTNQEGQTVHEDSKVLDAMGPQTTTFMISKPEGFPAGDYKVEISLDGKPVASKDFSVKK